MILYYALGGGLGHISRSLALIRHARTDLLPKIRLLVSSAMADIAVPYVPCEVDRIPPMVMDRHDEYVDYFNAYLKKHRFSVMVIDTFPFGLIGELNRCGREIPRILIGRYLCWEPYERVRGGKGCCWPERTLLLEEHGDAYRQVLERESLVEPMPGPVSLVSRREFSGSPEGCAVFHSGDEAEVAELLRLARQTMQEKGMAGEPRVITPAAGIYPLEELGHRFEVVVAGAGYGACAMASLLQGRTEFRQVPFLRRFDDQELRLQRLLSNSWAAGGSRDPAVDAARLLWSRVGDWC